MSLPFVKMHGLGNDYIYVDACSRPEVAERRDLPALARAVSDRHTGIGSDGLILVCRPTVPDAHARMRMFNADGSEAQMCGNGIRCVAKFAHDRLGMRAPVLKIETGRGTLGITYTTRGERLETATVDMGPPVFDAGPDTLDPGQLVERTPPVIVIEALGRRLTGTLVCMGNPHLVLFSDDTPGPIDLAVLGPALEHHPAFPQRINAHVATLLSRTAARITTWERGSGLTRACGTGACAVHAAGIVAGRLDRQADLHLPGGTLRVAWPADRSGIVMTGPATEVYEGVWPE